MAQYQHNLDVVQAKLPPQLKPRLVVKSLASTKLLQFASEKLNTQCFMVVHLPHLREIIGAFQQADILLGKPMPIHAAQRFYQSLFSQKGLNPQVNIQWLIDSQARLEQYLQLAQNLNLCLNINIEIDVGLHRGGVSSQEQFVTMLNLIRQHLLYLKFSGLMGYDAHVAKLPKILKRPEKVISNHTRFINNSS